MCVCVLRCVCVCTRAYVRVCVCDIHVSVTVLVKEAVDVLTVLHTVFCYGPNPFSLLHIFEAQLYSLNIQSSGLSA